MRVAIYARVSTQRQEKEQTIDSQIEQLEDYAKENEHIVVKRYVDDGWSGGLLARPALDQLRDDCAKEEKEFEAVLISSPDRLARKYVYQEIVTEEIQKSEARIIFLNRPIADTPEDKMLLGIQGLVAEYEKEKIKDRCRRGKLYKAKKGLVVGGRAPYGYRYVTKTPEKDGYYEIVEGEAQVVRQIFGLLIDDQMSVRGIAKYLTQHAVPPPRRGKKWGKSTVRRIVTNETYAGTTYYNKNYSVETANSQANRYRKNRKTGRRLRPRDQWIAISVPAIIDRRTWRLAQAQLRKNAELSPRNVKYRYLLQGLVFCGTCGSRYNGVPFHGNLYYRCSNRQRNFPLPAECKARSVKAPTLESAVWSSVCEAIKDPELLIGQLEELGRRRVNKVDVLQEKIRKIRLHISRLEHEEDRMLDAYRTGIVTLEQLREQMNKVRQNNQQLEEKEKRLLEERNEYVSHARTVENIKEFCNLLEQRLESFEFQERQKFLRLLLHKVVFEGDCIRIQGVIPLSLDMDRGGDKGNIATITSL